MPLRFYFILILIGVFSQSFAQKTVLNYSDQYKSKFLLKVSPTALLITSSNALLPIGVEYKMNKYLSFCGEVSVPLYYYPLKIANRSTHIKTLKFDTRLRADVRANIYHKPKYSLFAGIDAWYRYQNFTLENVVMPYMSQSSLAFDKADVKKTVYSINHILGIQHDISKRFLYEVQLGIGFYSINLVHSNMEGVRTWNNYQNNLFTGPVVGEDEDLFLGNDGFISLPFAFKLCYKL